MMVVLPLIMAPFLAIFFILLGGGTNASQAGKVGTAVSGLNANVPTASEDNVIYSSKLKAYEKVAEDSITRKQRNQHSFLDRGLDALLKADTSYSKGLAGSVSLHSTALNYDINLNREQQLNTPEYRTLLEAQGHIEESKLLIGDKGYKPHSGQYTTNTSGSIASGTSPLRNDYGTDDLYYKEYEKSAKQRDELLSMLRKQLEEQSVHTMNATEADINVPSPLQTGSAGNRKRKLKISSQQTKPVVVSQLSPKYVKSSKLMKDNAAVSEPELANGFYSPGKVTQTADEPNIFTAVIHNDQSLVAGSTVKMRLGTKIEVGNTTIPKGSFIYGVCSISNERLHIQINSIKYRELLYPLQLTVFDMDGIQGLYIPGSMERKAIKDGASQGVASTNILGFSPTIEAQVTQAAIEAGKNIVSKRAAAVRVRVKANHQVFLKPADTDEE